MTVPTGRKKDATEAVPSAKKTSSYRLEKRLTDRRMSAR
jgi:hypothetical protein